MTTHRVTGCDDCPLHAESGCEPWCGHPAVDKRVLGEAWGSAAPPDWCPLRAGDLLVHLEVVPCKGDGVTCHDCGVAPGQLHKSSCDVERCMCCKGQRISCGCKGPARRKREPWSGEFPGKAECRELGLWCVGPPWVPCSKDTPGAREDLNRLCEYEALHSTCNCD